MHGLSILYIAYSTVLLVVASWSNSTVQVCQYPHLNIILHLHFQLCTVKSTQLYPVFKYIMALECNLKWNFNKQNLIKLQMAALCCSSTGSCLQGVLDLGQRKFGRVRCEKGTIDFYCRLDR